MGTKPRASHHRSPGASRCAVEREQRTVIFTFEGRDRTVDNLTNLSTVSGTADGKLFSSMVLYVRRNHNFTERKKKAYLGLGKNGIGNESPGPPPSPHSSPELWLSWET